MVRSRDGFHGYLIATWLTVLLACGEAIPRPASAQQRSALGTGQRVRVLARPDMHRVIGQVRGLSDAMLELEAESGDRISFRREDIVRLERSLGRPNHIGKGALIGGGIGFGLGAGLGAMAVAGLCDSTDGCTDDYVPVMATVGVVFGAGGALLGVIFGGISSSIERWEPVRALPSEVVLLELGLLRQDGAAFFGIRLGVP